MKLRPIAFMMLLGNIAVADFGRFPIVSNSTYIAVADYQCIFSGVVERCRAADLSEPTISFEMPVYTGMYVSSVSTGTVVTDGSTNFYYTTNWNFGTADCTLSNFSGTNVYRGTNVINADYIWSGPMIMEDLQAWDRYITYAIPNYLDESVTNWLSTPIGAVTNKRVIYADPCADPLVPITNSYVANTYRTTPLMLSVSNLFGRLGVGTDFYYAYNEASTNYIYTNGNASVVNRKHDWRFTMIPTQSVVLPLCQWKVIVTNTFYTTNVSAGVTNVVENYGLALGTTNYQTYWWYINSSLPEVFPKVPVECINYQRRTNAVVSVDIFCPNTNAVVDLSDAKLHIIGATTLWTVSNAVGWSIGLRTTVVDGITQGEALDTPYHEVVEVDYVHYWDTVYDCIGACDWDDPDWYDCWMACDRSLISLTTSEWSRVETNGQWDSIIGTTVTLYWSNTVAFYGADQVASWNGIGSTYHSWPVSAQALNERYTVLTSLVTTCRYSPAGELAPEMLWLATYNERYGSDASCVENESYCRTLNSFSYATPAPTNTISETFAQGTGIGINSFYGGARFVGSAKGENTAYYVLPGVVDEPTYLANYAGTMFECKENLKGTPYIRIENVLAASNRTPPEIESVDVYAMPYAPHLYPAYLDEEDDDHLRYTLVGTVEGPLVGHIESVEKDFFSGTNWVFVKDAAITLPSYGLLGEEWWSWQKSSDAGRCASEDVCAHGVGGLPTPVPACIAAVAWTSLYGYVLTESIVGSETLYLNLYGFVKWVFVYK